MQTHTNRRHCPRQERRLRSIEIKLDTGELDILRDVKWSKSLAGYRIEFRGKNYCFEEDLGLGVQQPEDPDVTYSWTARIVSTGTESVTVRDAGGFAAVPADYEGAQQVSRSAPT